VGEAVTAGKVARLVEDRLCERAVCSIHCRAGKERRLLRLGGGQERQLLGRLPRQNVDLSACDGDRIAEMSRREYG
jgi:hypothetical protein